MNPDAIAKQAKQWSTAGAQCSSTANQTAPAPMNEVPSELNTLGASIENLEATAAALIGRLQAVLHPPTPVGDGCTEKCAGPSTDMGNQIQNQRLRVCNITTALNIVISRLAL
jgi:hypothetical protein